MELQVIHEQQVLNKEFRVYGDFENPLFLAKDVAEWIDYSKSGNGSYNISQMLKFIDEDEKAFLSTNNISREQWFLTEDGLFEVLMQSRKPIAKQFKKQVKEILKSIRKHGAYMTPDALAQSLADPAYMIGVLTELKKEQDARKLAVQRITELQPRAEKFDRVIDAHRLLSFEQVAPMVVEHFEKEYGVSIKLGKKRFPELLRSMGILKKDRKSPDSTEYRNLPCVQYENWFAVKATAWGTQTKVKPEHVTELIDVVIEYIAGKH